MRSVRFASLALAAAALTIAAPATAQDDLSGCFVRGEMGEAANRPSPLGATVVTINGEDAKICYGRPSAKGREIMGGLVPFGEIWRTGANEATALHLPFAAQVGGEELEAGVYSIYTIPGEDEWQIFLSTSYERWGIPVTDEVRAAEVASFTRPVGVTDAAIEQFTIRWDQHGEDMGHIVMMWENTKVEIPVHAAGMQHQMRH
jgi:hypothetical protein